MILTSLELNDFRNYPQVFIEFGEKKNFLIGNNAQGKTNILEAIYLLCLSRSFRTSYEKETIRFTAENCRIKGVFKFDTGTDKTIIFSCSLKTGKEISINRKRLSRASELIGNFPVVLYAADEYILTSGPPPVRRKFVDILLSQIHKKYFSYLQDYHQIIRQRNSILANWKISGVNKPSIIDPWDEKLVEIGCKIIEYRSDFAQSFSEILKKIYADLVNNNEHLTFDYQPNIFKDKIDDIQALFLHRLKQIRFKEIERGISLIGPHRDDFIFNINGKELRKFGSRGQHKTVLISLAFAQYDLISEKLQETPIILMDDPYSEIDSKRESKIIDRLNDMSQVFITATKSNINVKNNNDKYYQIEDGKIISLILSF